MSVLGRTAFSSAVKIQKNVSHFPGLLCKNLQTKPNSRITSYFLDKYVPFISTYKEILRKRFPTAVKLYDTFIAGLKHFNDDIMILFKAYTKVTTNGWDSLSRKELEVCYQMPTDIFRVAPVVLAFAVPGGAAVFVLAQYFPRYMLTHHFWSPTQKSEFSLIVHKRKLLSHRPLLKCMEHSLCCVKDNPLYEPMSEIIQTLHEGDNPSTDLILTCKPLFEKEPYGLSCLSRSHIVNLLKLFDMHRGWHRRKRLHDTAHFIHLMDTAIIKEGGFSALTEDEIKQNCFYRGLNPVNMEDEDMISWLDKWLMISQNVTKNSFSLLLHCPVLLGLNQPSNCWLLLLKDIKKVIECQ